MKWIQATNQVPKDQQEVLVINKNEFFIATYEADERKFRCKNGTAFGVREDVKWAELLPPPKNT